MGNLQNAIDIGLRKSADDIAIIGLDFILPNARTLEQLDQLFEKKIDCVSFPSKEKKELMKPFLEEGEYHYLPGAYIEGMDLFDYNFFKITKLEAELMDPYQRLFLQCGWKAFEDAGLTREVLKESRTGVYVGYPQKHDYFQKVMEIYPEEYMMAGTGNICSVIASRLSYILGLQGPAVMIDTACSSSLVALSQACNDIKDNRCDMALVGGLNLLIPNVISKDKEEMIPTIISPSFRTKAFSSDADGTGFCEGVIAIVLKRLKDAVKEKDNVYAVIKGTSINNDGISLGLTAPNQAAQEKVIKEAWKQARINPEKISYIEAHGTGTEIGDPIELSAIQAAFQTYTKKKQFCGIGSAKNYFGHADSAAGLVGLVKCLASFKYKKFYGNTNLLAPTDKFNFLDSSIYVLNENEKWSENEENDHIFGISAFGLSGTNCHVVLQEYNTHTNTLEKKENNSERNVYMLPISAKTETALKNYVAIFKAEIRENTKINLNDLCYTMQSKRNHYENRILFKFSNRIELINQMEDFLDEDLRPIYEKNEKIIQKYLMGQHVSWPLHEDVVTISLPTYPFEEKKVWLKKRTNIKEIEQEDHMKDLNSTNIEIELQEMVGNIFGIPVDEVSNTLEFFEMGFDSISIIQLKHAIYNEYQYDIDVEMLFSECNTIQRLAYKISSVTSVDSHNIIGMDNKNVAVPKTNITQNMIQDSYMKRFLVKRNFNLTKVQKEFLVRFSESYCRKFKTSMQQFKRNKEFWANGRFVQGYSDTWKELSFPIISENAYGANMVDMDGNKFLDFCMGFGVNLFGYNNQFISDELKKNIDKALLLGPIKNEAYEVAKLICSVTGVDRVAFCNSGTEAIMNIIRIARGATNRKRIVVFKNSYHGTFDGVYVTNSGNSTVPISIGTNQEMVEQVTVLNYGVEQELKFIKENCATIAAVLVEPIQSRNPELQPYSFLKKLRKLTSEENIVLVFDEIINGFRLALGGAQEYYGIQADMVAYGKVIGGGLPIGIYAGKKEYMDYIDGGCIVENTPSKMVVQTGGTFCHHPLAMTAAKTVLHYLVKDNGRLQKRLNYKTKTMADLLNEIFEEYKIPLHIAVGGSQFIMISDDMPLMRMIYYMLLYHNIYIWEGGTCYLSTEHTDEDIICMVKTVLESLKELTAGRYCSFASEFEKIDVQQYIQILRNKLIYDDMDIACLDKKDREKAYQLLNKKDIEFVVPATPMQNMVLASNLCGRNEGTDCVIEKIEVKGEIDDTILRQACDYALTKNPVLRSDYEWRGWTNPVQVTYRNKKCDFYYDSISHLTKVDQNKIIQEKVHQIKRKGFVKEKSKIKFFLWNKGNNKYTFSMIYLNSLFDGWSSNCLIYDIFNFYKLIRERKNLKIKTDNSFISYAIAMAKKEKQQEKFFWEGALEGCREISYKEEISDRSSVYKESHCQFVLSLEKVKKIKKLTSKWNISISIFLQTAWIITKAKYDKCNEILVGIAVSGRNNSIRGIDTSIGLYTNILPLFYIIKKEKTLEEIAVEIGEIMRNYLKHEDVTIYEISQFTDIPVKVLNYCVDNDVVVYLNFPETRVSGSSIQVEKKEEEGNLNITRRIYVTIGEEIEIMCKYNKNQILDEEVSQIMELYNENIYKMINEEED